MALKKLLFLGDSFTVGTGLGAGKEKDAFPFQLIDRLKSQGAEFADPKMYAIDGHTTKHLLGVLDYAEPLSNPDHPENKTTKGDYDMVVLSMGINDVFRGHDAVDYSHHFNELLQRAIRFAGGDASKVMVVSIPAWDASPSVFDGSGTDFRESKYELVRGQIFRDKGYNTKSGIAEEIDIFNEAAREVVDAENKKRGAQNKIQFVDITDITRKGATIGDGADAKPDKTLFADDGIHYSGEMYAKWVDRILPIAQKMFGMTVTARTPRAQAV